MAEHHLRHHHQLRSYSFLKDYLKENMIRGFSIDVINNSLCDVHLRHVTANTKIVVFCLTRLFSYPTPYTLFLPPADPRLESEAWTPAVVRRTLHLQQPGNPAAGTAAFIPAEVALKHVTLCFLCCVTDGASGANGGHDGQVV